jgi:TPR repeat protein
VRDIALVEAALLKLGFTVDKLENQDKRGMELNINRFVTKSAGADTALVFYAGHGTQSSKGGRSYLLPVNAKVEDDETLETDGVLAEDIANKLEQISNPAKLRLVILDACRSRKTTRGNDRGLAPPRPTDDFTLIAYSTKDGATADDGNGIHSPYAQALAKHLPRLAKEPVRVVLDDLGDDVKTATKQGQKPQSYGNLTYRIGLDGVQVVSVSVNPLDSTQVAFADLARKATSGDPSAIAELERNPVFLQLKHRFNVRASADRQSVAMGIAQTQSTNPEERALGEGMLAYLRTFPQTGELKKMGNEGNPFAALMLDFEYRFDSISWASDDDQEGIVERVDNSQHWKMLIEDAVSKLALMAKNDNLVAQIWLGNHYSLNNRTVEKALTLYQQAALQGNAFAYYCIGRLYRREGDGEKSLFWYRKGADAGDAWAMGELGNIYTTDAPNRPADYKKAIEWYERAAAAGDVFALGSLGAVYQHYKEIPRAEAKKKSLEWLEKGVEKGDVRSMWALAETYGKGFIGVDKDGVRAASLYEMAAETESIGTKAFQLASFYADGSEGLQKHEGKALKWFEEAMRRGGTFAVVAVADVYLNGQGVVKSDPHRAINLYRQAASAGSYKAMFALGSLYGFGFEKAGIAKDRAKSLEWYLKGISVGGGTAMYKLGSKYDQGRGGLDRDLAKAMEWYRKGADAGSVPAMRALGAIYEYGRDGSVPIDKAEAAMWSQRAGPRSPGTK